VVNDLVIDTNVFVHAQNPSEQRCASSLSFLESLLSASATSLCVDQGFSSDLETNKSHIGGEYLNNLRAGSFALNVIVTLASTRRIRQVARRAPQASAKKINQLLRNKRDRIFLSVAFNSLDKILVSHDYQDFQNEKRYDIRKRLGVMIEEADASKERL
jgi:hypothetical protein